jgi:hypothetical protein
MKHDDINIVKAKIRLSWVVSSSRAPIPSESITITFNVSPSGVYPTIGLAQTQSPL